MCPTYDYLCEECGLAMDAFVKYDDRDAPQTCAECGGQALRAWLTAPQTRTAKTSRTFLDGQRSDGFSEEIKAAKLDAEAMKHHPDSDSHRGLKAEAKARRLLNNNKEVRDKLKSKSKLTKSK